MMVYPLLKYIHLLGAVLMSAGLIGVWLADVRSRQVEALELYTESVRWIAVFYDGLVLPGAFLSLLSGVSLIALYYGGLGFLDHPWLIGMVGLFLFEFIEGNTLTRRYFTRLRRLSQEAVVSGRARRVLCDTRDRFTPTFAHFLDLPIITIIIALGVIRPYTWEMMLSGTAAAIVIAAMLAWFIPRLYPWKTPHG